MEKSDIRYKTYVDILKRELLPAMGCTEPIAIAYCAARARALLGCIPDSVLIEASGNIIKALSSPTQTGPRESRLQQLPASSQERRS